MARITANSPPAVFAEVVDLLRQISHDIPRSYQAFSVIFVTVADRVSMLQQLDDSGLLSEMGSSGSGDLVRAAAFAYWRLGRHDRAAELQAVANSRTAPEPELDLGARVLSAIENFGAIGTEEAAQAAWSSFAEMDEVSEKFWPLAAELLVIGLDEHSLLRSEVGDAMLAKLTSVLPEQSAFRLAAFISWRRGDAAAAAESQERSLNAPFRGDMSHVQYIAARINARPDLYRR
ncbi:MAG: hypothetical protein Q8L48_11120 [Archangium sp.]|nr:hypothetical protein [Archangium sp.]